MKKIILSALMLVGLATTASAQSFPIEVRAGVNLSDIRYGFENDNSSSFAGTKAGINITALTEFEVADYLFFRPGVSLMSLGDRNHITDPVTGESSTLTTDLMYLQVPLTLSLRADYSSDLALEVNGGVYLGYGLGGQVILEEVASNGQISETKNDAFGKTTATNVTADLQNFDFGVKVGVGAYYMEKYYLGVSLDYGLANMSHNTGSTVGAKNIYNNRNFSIVLGYRF